ncbi:hypothetical protein [Sporosarcina koreensis]|uniref:Lipoprotein n=1 Tax=Sporosarcina koreensis TaxID=334735 RepID=A0ABW0TU03_9BACL
MQSFKRYCLFVILALLLPGCANEKKESSTKITFEPYTMSEQESLLISKTGVGYIEFFKLNGTLGKDDDLEFSVEVYENGKFKEELLKTWGAVDEKYKDSIISFGMSDYQGEDDSSKSFKLISGIPSGLATTSYPNDVTAYSFSKLVGEKITLKKNEPVYLAAWVGTTKNSLRSIGSENGELPAGIDEYENALLYKVLWTDKK